jgi:tRNA (guanine37-N1)-methyltransferase
MEFKIVTLFPEFFDGPIATGLLGKAVARGLIRVECIDLRTFARDRHRTVDDAPYGGGAGMLLKPEPLVEAMNAAGNRGSVHRVLLTPQGRKLSQSDLRKWAELSELCLVAGRYEGFDERVRARVDDEVSLGDFVLTGGEYAALAIIDGVTRLLPGTLGNAASSGGDSFGASLLEHAQYTRPEVFENEPVPEVLRSGHHEAVDLWRRRSALSRTAQRRPDLLLSASFTDRERAEIFQDSEAPLVDLVMSDSVAMWLGAPEIQELTKAYGVRRVALVGPDRAPLGFESMDRWANWSEGPPGISVEWTGLGRPPSRSPAQIREAARRRGHPIHLLCGAASGLAEDSVSIPDELLDLPEAAIAVGLDRLRFGV